MPADCLLWVDLRQRRCSCDAFVDVPYEVPASRIAGAGEIAAAISRHRPLLLCFDYDEPDRPGLLALEHTKQQHPHLPIVMLTEHHSEELAVWALRARVWDYLVKPLAPLELRRFLQALLSLCGAWKVNGRRSNLHPLPPLPPLSARSSASAEAASRDKTKPAVRYVEQHYQRPVELETVAALCRLSPSRFGHVFKAELGVPFGVYLARYRLAQARELLLCSAAPVNEVAFSVGFSDPAYFSRVFHAASGMSPRTFRHTGYREPPGTG